MEGKETTSGTTPKTRAKVTQESENWNPYKDDYKVSKEEEQDVHLLIEQIEYDLDTGEKISKPQRIIKNTRQFERDTAKSQVFPYGPMGTLGHTIVRVLHAPKGINFDIDEHYKGNEQVLKSIKRLTK